MKSLPYWFLGAATLFVVAGMLWGMQMSITRDYQLAPAHAHNNLIGFVTMAVYGFYYRLVPAAAARRLAVVHFCVALLGALLFGPGIALAVTGQGEIMAEVSSILVLLAALLFAWTVWTNKAGLTNP
jgi:cbb3-type cytochrome oxidase subunit 1